MDLVVAVFIYILIGMVITIWAYHDDDLANDDLLLLILSIVAWLPILSYAIIKIAIIRVKRK